MNKEVEEYLTELLRKEKHTNKFTESTLKPIMLANQQRNI